VGQVRQQQRTFMGVVTTVIVCPDCHGQGEIVDQACSQCNGKRVTEGEEEVEVSIPAGIANGQELVLRGRGDAAPDGPTGDLYVLVRVEPHELFEREDSDLHTHLTISFTQAALGNTVTIPTLEDEVELEIPTGTQPGTELRLPGHGLVAMDSRRHGDLIVHIQVAVPERLTARQQGLLRELAAEEDRSR